MKGVIGVTSKMLKAVKLMVVTNLTQAEIAKEVSTTPGTLSK